jgi:hypothetical protein
MQHTSLSCDSPICTPSLYTKCPPALSTMREYLMKPTRHKKGGQGDCWLGLARRAFGEPIGSAWRRAGFCSVVHTAGWAGDERFILGVLSFRKRSSDLCENIQECLCQRSKAPASCVSCAISSWGANNGVRECSMLDMNSLISSFDFGKMLGHGSS